MYQYTYTGSTAGDLENIGPVESGMVITPRHNFKLEAALIASGQFSRQLLQEAPPEAEEAPAQAVAEVQASPEPTKKTTTRRRK